MKTITVIFAVLIFSGPLFPQSEKSEFGISLSGYVKTDIIYDTRQTTALREGHFLLYPSAPLYDVRGNDVNAEANFNILAIQTRLTGKISGPDAFGAKTSGLIEGEFFGTSDADASGFRLRHALIKFDWTGISLLAGQYWHPMFIAEMFPGVVSFNTGAPFQPFSRNPQIRITYTCEKLKLITAAMTQRDFQSSGPGGLSTTYLRNAKMPNLHGQLQYAPGKDLFGIGIDYKIIRPALLTAKNFQTDATVDGFSALAFCKLTADPVTLKLEGTYGENLSDQLMLGGYAVKSVDTTSGIAAYTAIRSYSVWGEVSTGREIELALFGGYSKNLGAKENIAGTYYGRGTDIDELLRIAPRIQLSSGNARISGEIEYTRAGYGVPDSSDKGHVVSAKNISNTRFLIAVFYFF